MDGLDGWIGEDDESGEGMDWTDGWTDRMDW